MKKRTLDEVKDIIEKKYNGQIKILSENYENNKKPLKVKCMNCGYKRYISFNKLSIDSRCSKCSHKLKKDTKSFAEEVSRITNREYELIGEYTNTSTKVFIKHKKCGYIWKVLPKKFCSKICK